MAKWVLDQWSNGPLDYPSLGFTAQPGNILSASAAPDSRWSLNGNQAAAENVYRYKLGNNPDYVEPTDGHVLTWSKAQNTYVPTAPETVGLPSLDEAIADKVDNPLSATRLALDPYLDETTKTRALSSLALMAAFGQADAIRSAGFQRVAFEDFPLVNEPWSSLAAWTTSSMAVSGGFMAYSGSGTNVRIARPVSLGTTTTMRMRTSIVLPAAAGASNYVLVGVTAAGAAAVTAGGAALATADAIVAAGFDSSTNALISFVGTGAGGSGAATFIPSTAPPTGTIHVTVTVDETWLSILLRSADGTWEGGARWLRTDVGAINNLVIRNADARAASGAKIGTLEYRRAFASLGPAVTDTTPGPTVTIPQNASRLRILTPAGYDSRVANSLVLYCHGYTGSGLSTAPPPLGTNADVAAFATALADARFIVASSDGGGTTEWGSTAGLQEHLAAYRYVRDHYAIRNVILIGVSMGGLSSLRLIADGLIPAVGWLGLAPVVSLRNQYDDNTEHAASIRAAWGIAGDGSDYASKTAGGDPNLLPAPRFRGLPMMVRTNANDAVVNPARHTDLLSAKVSGTAREWSKETVAGSDHLGSGVYDTTTILPFLRRCASS